MHMMSVRTLERHFVHFAHLEFEPSGSAVAPYPTTEKKKNGVLCLKIQDSHGMLEKKRLGACFHLRIRIGHNPHHYFVLYFCYCSSPYDVSHRLLYVPADNLRKGQRTEHQLL